MTTEQIIGILDANAWLFNYNNIISSFFRWLGWAIAKFLISLASLCSTLYDKVFGFVDFSSSPQIQTFADEWQPVLVGIICLSLFFVGLILILSRDKRPKVMLNIFIFVFIVTCSTYVFSQLNSLLVAGKDAIIEDSGGIVGSTVADNLFDLVYIENNLDGGLASLPGQGTANSADYPRVDSIDEHALLFLDINTVLNYRTDQYDFSDNSKEIIKYEIITKGDGTKELQEVYNGFGWNSADDSDLFNGFVYRYKADWFPLYLSLFGMVLVFFFMSYKVVRLLFEIGVFRILALVTSANLAGGRKILGVLDAIKNSYIVLLVTCVLIRLYELAINFISSDASLAEHTVLKGILIIFVSLAVIDGPNLIQSLFGIDAGLSAGIGHVMAGYSFGRAAVGTVTGAARGAARIGRGIAGSVASGGNSGKGTLASVAKDNKQERPQGAGVAGASYADKGASGASGGGASTAGSVSHTSSDNLSASSVRSDTVRTQSESGVVPGGLVNADGASGGGSSKDGGLQMNASGADTIKEAGGTTADAAQVRSALNGREGEERSVKGSSSKEGALTGARKSAPQKAASSNPALYGASGSSKSGISGVEKRSTPTFKGSAISQKTGTRGASGRTNKRDMGAATAQKAETSTKRRGGATNNNAKKDALDKNVRNKENDGGSA